MDAPLVPPAGMEIQVYARFGRFLSGIKRIQRSLDIL